MSNRLYPRRGRRAGLAVAAVLALGIVPAAAEASAVNLATVKPFVVLGGSTVTNTGPSVLNGDLGLAPGTSLTGFGLPAVVNGTTHANDAVASKAQADLGTAFGVAGGQPVPPGNELTGIDLGGLSLTPGAYGFSSSAQLTGQLTLNAEGDPNAQFVFIIGSTLTTASASSVNLINGASPCNVFWRVGSSATLGTGTAFQGNLMALTDISLNDSVTVLGRVLAENGQVTLINDVLDNSQCTTEPPPTETETEPPTETETEPPPTETETEPPPTETEPPPTETGPPPPSETETTPPTQTETTPPSEATPPVTPVATPPGGVVTPPGTTIITTPTPEKKPVVEKAHGPKVHKPVREGSAVVTHSPQGPNGTAVIVNGHAIQKVVVSVDHKKVGSSTKGRSRTNVNGAPGTHKVEVHITYTDETPDKTTTFDFHVPSPAPLHPHHGPSQFTG